MTNVALGYDGVGNFLVSIWDRRKQLLYANGSACMAWQNDPTPECVVNGTECYDGRVWAIYYLYVALFRQEIEMKPCSTYGQVHWLHELPAVITKFGLFSKLWTGWWRWWWSWKNSWRILALQNVTWNLHYAYGIHFYTYLYFAKN